MKNINYTENTICMDREKVIEFIKRNIEKDADEVKNEIIEVLLHMIPLLGYYEEEGKKINFKIAFGINDMSSIGSDNGFMANFYVIKRYDCKQENIENNINKVKNMIKQVAIFCEKDANIFLIQNKDIIECGIYIPKLNNTQNSEDKFLEKNFIIFENLYKNKMVIKAKEEALYICMDFDKENVIGNNGINVDKDVIVRKWRGIFERVKRNVHGTICLIVDSKWEPCNDGNYTSKKIDTVDFELKLSDNPSVDEIQDFSNKLDMFLAMLDYDGITIIDTEEKIRAYNLFCKISSEYEVNTNGGARHRAYEFLKNLEDEKRTGYVAIYFQSQEGEIEFYEYGKNQDVKHYFDASIMMKTNKDSETEKDEEIKKNYQQIVESCKNENIEDCDLNTYLELRKCIDNLNEAHCGIDNFYNEPDKARELQKFISENIDTTKDILNKYTKIRRDLLNIVFRCIIGHVSGYSYNAQKYLNDIINDNIDEGIYIKYFENKEYLDPELLWPISSTFLYERWKNILSDIKKKCSDEIVALIKENEYDDEREYRHMYNVIEG